MAFMQMYSAQCTCRTATHALHLYISWAALIKHSPASKKIQVTKACTPPSLKYCFQKSTKLYTVRHLDFLWLLHFRLTHRSVMVWCFLCSTCCSLSHALSQQTSLAVCAKNLMERVPWGLCYYYSRRFILPRPPWIQPVSLDSSWHLTELGNVMVLVSKNYGVIEKFRAFRSRNSFWWIGRKHVSSSSFFLIL